MLQKGALEVVEDPGLGFYSRLFLVEKATGGWRPVIDLSPLNGFVQLTPFRMETVTSVLASIREGDFLASIDLKDAYFQVPIHRSIEARKLPFRMEARTEVTVSIRNGVSWTNPFRGDRSITGLHPPVAFSTRKRRL